MRLFLFVVLGCLIAAVTLGNAAVAAKGEVGAKVEQRAALDKLFAQLKSAKDKAGAQPIVDKIWREWFKTDNAEVEALMSRVQFARRAGLHEQAIKELDKIIQLAPDYVEGWNQRATIYFIMGRDAESVADIQQVLRLEPRHFGALAGLGLIHMRAENWKSAIASFERALELHPFLGERAFIPELKQKLKGQPL